MAGSPKSVNTDTPIDPKYLQYVNSLSSGGNTTNITSSRDSIKQYVKTKNGIFNGAFGSVGHILTISSGILNLTANSIGAVVVRRMIQINPESSTSDTIDKIQTNGLELPYQELTLIATTNNTITLAHASSVSGTQKNIYCPGDTSYVLAPNEAVKLIYDPINTIWIVTGSVGSSTTVDNNSITFAKIQDIATMKVIGRTASGSGDSSEISILDEDTMSSNSATALATQQSIKAYVLANSGVGLSDNNIWTGTAIFDTTASGSTTSSPIKFQGDGNNTAQRVMEIGEYGAHGVKFIAEILGDSGRTMTNPDGGSDINVPGSNEPALSIKSAMIMNTYTMYDLDSLVFSQGASSTTPPPENDWVYIEANTGTSGSPSLTGMTYNVPTGKTHQFKVNGALKVSIDDDIEFEANSTLEISNTIAIPSSLSASGGAMAPPTNPTAYFKVHYNGADRYIPYYT